MLPWTLSLGAGTASFALEATETPWKENKKSVLRPRLFGGNDELGGGIRRKFSRWERKDGSMAMVGLHLLRRRSTWSNRKQQATSFVVSGSFSQSSRGLPWAI